MRLILQLLAFIDLIFACAYGLLNILPTYIPGTFISVVYKAAPVALSVELIFLTFFFQLHYTFYSYYSLSAPPFNLFAALKIALTGFAYPVHLHMFPAIPSLTSSSVGLLFSSSNALAVISKPGVQ